MSPRSLDEQLTKYLTDAHSIEEQALVQLRAAPKIAGDPEIAAPFERHLSETERHESLVRRRLQARDASPAALKDLAGKVTGKGFALFARLQPDTPGKLVAHAYSYEHLELAAYELLRRVAERAGDADTAAAAAEIRGEEEEMGQRLAALFDQAVEASLRQHPREELGKQVTKYLTDAHGLEAQAIQLLKRGPKIAGTTELAAAFEEHLEETREHERMLTARLAELGAGPSRIKDTALSLGALNWGAFFAAQPDTPAKLAGFAYAFEHLEIAGYELLRRVAERAGDEATVRTADAILPQERAAAERIFGLFAPALDASLRAQDVPVA
jgi:ferritin-like metal-binding protein YciE